jgi:hypothetical protein
MDTPVTQPSEHDVMAIARTATVLVGSYKSVLEKLNELYPLEVKSDTNPTPKFYSDMSFEAQLNKLLNYNKYKNSHFVYGIMYYHQSDSSPERAQMAKDMNIPETVVSYRIQRVELHR